MLVKRTEHPKRDRANHPVPGTPTPIKLPDGSSEQHRQPLPETPKVGSQDAPGG
jgi:hypothetical protein